MRPIEDTGRFDDAETRWNDASQDDGVGPQGEALILELQRLREAFDDDDGTNRRYTRQSRDGAGPIGIVAAISRSGGEKAGWERRSMSGSRSSG